jgi:hypothetical protein
VLAAFPCELLKNGSRAMSVSTEGVNRERAELETAFPRCVIIHPEQLVYVRLSVEKGGCLADLSESSRMSGRPRGLGQERDTLLRLRKARYNSDIKRRRHPVSSSAFTCVWRCKIEISGTVEVGPPLRFRKQSPLLTLAAQVMYTSK